MSLSTEANQRITAPAHLQHLCESEIVDAAVYARFRRSVLGAIMELRHGRRISLGDATLVFECRDTVLFQIHEILRIEGDSRAARLRELGEYQCLVPAPDRLTATLLIDGACQRRGQAIVEALAAGRPVLRLAAGNWRVTAELAAPTLGPFNPVQYIRFPLAAGDLEWLRSSAGAMRLELAIPGCDRITHFVPGLRGRLAALLLRRDHSSLIGAMARATA